MRQIYWKWLDLAVAAWFSARMLISWISFNKDQTIFWLNNLISLRWCTVHRKWEREVQKWFIFELDNWLKWPLITSSALALLWQRILMPCFANGKNKEQWTFLVFLIFKYWSQGSSLWTKCLETTDNCSNYILPMQPCSTDTDIGYIFALEQFYL